MKPGRFQGVHVESDLDFEEHYTDTHGYDEINFAAFFLMDMRSGPARECAACTVSGSIVPTRHATTVSWNRSAGAGAERQTFV